MPPIGSVLRNSIVYMVIMAISVFVAVNSFIFPGLVNLIIYADDLTNETAGDTAITGLFVGFLIIFLSLGLALNLTLPSIVGDEMIEF